MTAVKKRIDHIESVCEELTMNGYTCKVVNNKIEYDAIFGTMIYTCTEKTFMADFYRFIYHLGGRLHSYGLKQKNKENFEQFKKTL